MVTPPHGAAVLGHLIAGKHGAGYDDHSSYPALVLPGRRSLGR
jgi:hypothetical protein